MKIRNFEDLIANSESEYICENMEQLIVLGDIQSLIQLNPDKFKEINSVIVCKMTGIRTQFLDSITSYGLTK